MATTCKYPNICEPARCPNGKCRMTNECVDPKPLARSQRIVVGLVGLAGCGKSTAAARLVDSHGYKLVKFAGPLKAAMRALGLTDRHIEGDLKEQPCDLLCGKTPRWAMQTMGTEWGRDIIGADLWVNAWKAAVAAVPAGVPVVADDCRFLNEAYAVKALGGVVIQIERESGGGLSSHTSEAGAKTIRCNLRIDNGGDLPLLVSRVDQLHRDLIWAFA